MRVTRQECLAIALWLKADPVRAKTHTADDLCKLYKEETGNRVTPKIISSIRREIGLAPHPNMASKRPTKDQFQDLERRIVQLERMIAELRQISIEAK